MLTMQTRAPYNRFDMSVDDPALAAAIRRHEERLARDPASLAFAQLADLYRKAGRTRQAVAVCRNGLQCHRLAAEIHRRLGHIDRAVTHLEAAVRLDPGDRDSRSLLGLLHATTPSAGEASGLQRVLADETFATIAFGTLCLEQGCVEEAAQAFTRILRKDPDNHEARERLETTLHARQRRKG